MSNPSLHRHPRVTRALRAVALALVAVGCSTPDVPRRPELELHDVPPAAIFCVVEPKPPAAPSAPDGGPAPPAPPPPPGDAPPKDTPTPAPPPLEVPAADGAPPSPGQPAPPVAPPPSEAKVAAATAPVEPQPAPKPDPKTCAIDCTLTCGAPTCERQADGTVLCSSFTRP